MPSTTAPALSDPALEAALVACEAGDWAGIRQLREWHHGRLRTTLERMLGDPDLAARALEAVLDDIWQQAGTHRGAGVSAEDWVFGRLRLQARALQAGSPLPPRLKAVPSDAGSTADVPDPVEQPAPAPAAHAVAPPTVASPAQEEILVEDFAPAINPKLRRHRANPAVSPAQPKPSLPAPARPARRGWLLTLLVWLLAGAVGFGIALVALGLLRDGAAPEPGPARPASPPAVASPQLQPTEPAVPDVPASARAAIGDPLAASEPPMIAMAQAPEPAAQDPAGAAPAAGAVRVFIHHAAGDTDGAALARRLAGGMPAGTGAYVEVKEVPFRIVTASVRYFHPDDRDAAAGLVAAIRPDLAASGRAAPSTPIDFTDFRPIPRPGTIEIWLPAR